MNIIRAIPSPVAYALRVVHIALWMTIPATFWLWLTVAKTPAECVPQYGWYKGNVLCISEGSHLLIVASLFLMGFIVVCCWVGGYSGQLIGRSIQGDNTLPPVRRRFFAEGFRLFGASLRYWLPAIALATIGYTILSRLPREVASPAVESLVVASAPVALAMFWGNLIGLARFAANGEIASVWRRRENLRLALTNIRATLLLSLLLILVTGLAFTAMALPEGLQSFTRSLDLLAQAALAAFVFFFVLLCWSIACSHLIARYAIKIGICDRLKSGATHGNRGTDGLMQAPQTVLE